MATTEELQRGGGLHRRPGDGRTRQRRAGRRGRGAYPHDLPSGKSLNDGQWDAVTGLLNSENRINLVEGPAGAGKSSLLTKYRRRHAAGRAIGDVAGHDDATPARVLAKDGFEANTVARFLRR